MRSYLIIYLTTVVTHVALSPGDDGSRV